MRVLNILAVVMGTMAATSVAIKIEPIQEENIIDQQYAQTEESFNHKKTRLSRRFVRDIIHAAAGDSATSLTKDQIDLWIPVVNTIADTFASFEDGKTRH